MYDDIANAFDRGSLRRICQAPEKSFGNAYGLGRFVVPARRPNNFYYFRDNGSDVLAVAHLDTVAPANQRTCAFLDTAAGPVVYSRALDDRLGAYIILDLLPTLGVTHDVLLTVGEETGESTAEYFDALKDYNWMIEFDRGGTDVVMYQYDDETTASLVRDSGARVGDGIFSDICYLEHLGVKGFNWGTGYRDYHSSRAHAYLDDTFTMVNHYLNFHETNADTPLPHDARYRDAWLSASDDDTTWENDDYVEYPTLRQLREVID